MNKNIIIVLAGGFLVATLVAILVQASLKGGKDKNADVNQVEVLVAAKDLGVGRDLREGDLRWQVWPETAVFTGAVIRQQGQTPTEAMTGKLLRSLSDGQPLHSSLIAAENMGDFLSANVKKGMRAVGIEVKKDVLADRLIRPGDFVDVMVTYRVNVNSRTNPEAQSYVSRYASETVIENVRILAVDTNDTKAVDEEDEDGKKKKQKSASKAIVTLEVTPNNAEILVLADKMGDISLALRSIGDNTNPKDDKSTTDVGMSRVMTKLADMNGTSSGVRIYNGRQMNEVRARNVERSGDAFELEEDTSPPATIVIDDDTLQRLQELQNEE